jgi:hypothetical protein
VSEDAPYYDWTAYHEHIARAVLANDRSDRGSVTTATTLTALIVTGLVALGVYAHHLADQGCHQRATTVQAHELCEVLAR